MDAVMTVLGVVFFVALVAFTVLLFRRGARAGEEHARRREQAQQERDPGEA